MPPDATPQPQAQPHLERSVRAGVLWKLVGQVGTQGTRLVTVAVLARLLQPEDYGAAAIAVTLASFAPTLGDMGMGSAFVQTDRDSQQIRSTAFWGSLAFGAGMSALFIAFAWPAGELLGDSRIGPIVSVGAVAFVIYSFGSTSQAAFIRAMEFRTIELRYLVALAAASVLSISAASVGLGPWALVLQQIVLITTFVVALWWRTAWRPTFEFSGEAFWKLSTFAIQIAGGRWARLLELIVLSLLIGKLVSVSGLGVWTFAWSAVILPLTVIALPIGDVFFSAFSRLRGERERIAALWLDSVCLLAAVIVPLLVGLVVVAPDLIPLVFGSQWAVSVAIIQILSVYVIIRSLQAWNSIVLDAAGRPKITLWTQVGALCITPLAVAVGAHWGLEGVAAAFVVSQLLAVELPSLIFVLHELGIAMRTVALRLRGVAAAALLMAIACLGGRLGLAELGIDMTGRAVLTVALGAMVYPTALRFLSPDTYRRGVGLMKPGFDRMVASAPSRRRA